VSYIETRQVANDKTIQFDNKIYLIARTDIRAGLRGGSVRAEVRLDGSLAGLSKQVLDGHFYLAHN
jgi:hypothetical protein